MSWFVLGCKSVSAASVRLNENIHHMQYTIIAHRPKGATLRGKVTYTDIDEAIKMAYTVAKHYHCYCTIEKVAA